MAGNEVLPAATNGVHEAAAASSAMKEEHDPENPSLQPAAGASADTGTLASADAGPLVSATNYATRLAYYMPTGTTTTFVVLSKAILEDGRCHAKPHNGEVAMMALLTSILGVFCFLSSFLKPVQQTNADGSVTTRSVLIPLDDVKLGKTGGAAGQTGGEGHTSRASNRNGYSGWPLWIHALVSTLAFMAFALTSPECTSCFFYFPKAVGQGVPILVALIAGIIFGFLPNPEPDQKTAA